MKKIFLICLLFLISVNALGVQSSDLLHPDKAFQFSASWVGRDAIKLEWKVAKGYYLYRNKMSATSGTPDMSLQEIQPLLPPGEVKVDPNFGKLEVYHHDIAVDIPLQHSSAATAPNELIIQAKYQGCADAGICFAPQYKTITLQLAAADTSTSPNNSKTITDASPQIADTPATTVRTPTKRISDTNTDTLPVEQAFQYSLIALDRNTLMAHWEITPGHHLYRTKIKFSVKSPTGIHLGTPLFPDGKIVEDEYFGTMEVFGNSLDASIPLQSTSPDQALPEVAVITTEYQGCSDLTGICYPPVIQETELRLSGLPKQVSLLQQEGASGSAGDDYSSRIASAGFFGTIALFFGIGVLLAFTPCIFPMIPILSGIIAGQSDLSVRKGFLLSLVYVGASATAYALIGVVFGIFGANLQSALQHPAAIGTFAALFVVLALSMFGFFDLQLPNSLQTRLNELSNRQQSGSLIGAAIMGFLSTLIVGPCVAPPLAGALTYIAQTKDALLGGSALFSMGFGMGLPLIVVGMSAGHWLPRAGAWMNTTKVIFGIMMLGLAIWMLSRIIPAELTMALTGILLVASGTHMGALDRLNEGASGWDRFWKSTGMILLFYGAMQLLGVANGSTNLLQPLKGVFTSTNASASTVSEAVKPAFLRIKTEADLEQALASARQNGQSAMLDFYADWCTECIRMEKNTFVAPEVRQALSNVLLLQADVTANDAHDIALQKKFGIIGPPSIVFFDKKSNEIRDLMLIGYEGPQAFTQRIQTLHNR